MPAINRQFQGNDFFSQIRTDSQWLVQKGSFWGYDDSKSLHYIIMDASFYNLGIFDRSNIPSGSFSDLALSYMGENPRIKVITNGQFFHSLSGVGDPQGGLIIDGANRLGATEGVLSPEESYNSLYTFGQYTGKGEQSYALLQGNTTNKTFTTAIGGMRKLIENAIPGSDVHLFPYGLDHDRPKTLIGLHRRANCTFVLVDGSVFGDGSLGEIQNLLLEMEVDDAVVLDGSASVTLVVDNSVEVRPYIYRDSSIPSGPYFKYQSLEIASISAFENEDINDTLLLDEGYFIATQRLGLRGGIDLTSNGYELTITTLSSIPPSSVENLASEIRSALANSASFPIALRAERAFWGTFPPRFLFYNSGGIRLVVDHIANSRDDAGHLKGQMTIPTTDSSLTFNVSFHLL